MAYPAPHIVSVAGAHCSGKTHLVRALGGLLETFEAFTGQTDEDFTRKAAIERKFKHGMAAARCAAGGRGAVIDGSIDDELALLEVDLHHARVDKREAAALFKYGAALAKFMPVPSMAIHLDTTPEMCLERAPEASDLALADHAALDESARDSVAALEAKGCEVYKRKWGSFDKAKVNCVRDTVLCAPPTSMFKDLAPPSEAAVERILRDEWAAAQPPRSRRSVTTATTGAEVTSPSPRTPLSTASSDMVNASPASCSSPIASSPASIATSFENLRNPKQSLFAPVAA